VKDGSWKTGDRSWEIWIKWKSQSSEGAKYNSPVRSTYRKAIPKTQAPRGRNLIAPGIARGKGIPQINMAHPQQ